MYAVLALALKDLLLLKRDRVGFFFAFLFPVLIALFFGAVFSGDGNEAGSMRLLVIDEDETERSRAFIGLLTNETILRVESAERGDAVEQVRQGRADAYVVLPSGYAEARRSLFMADPPELLLGVDPARKGEAAMLNGLLFKISAKAMQEDLVSPGLVRERIAEVLSDTPTTMDAQSLRVLPQLRVFLEALDGLLEGVEQEQADAPSEDVAGFTPVRIRELAIVEDRTGPPSGYAVSFPQGILWGILGCAATFGISLVLERSRGTLARLLCAPIALGHILAGKALACLMTTLFISVALSCAGALFFGVRPGSWLLLFFSLLSVCLGFVGIMMLLSVLGRTERSAGGIGWSVLLMMSMLGGGMVPLFFMPPWMRTLGNISPVKWAILALEGALWRNFSFTELVIPCGVVLLFGLLCFAVGLVRFRQIARA